MSVKQKLLRLAAGLLFVFLLIFNVQFSLTDDNRDNVDLFGLKISSFVSDTYATIEYGTEWRRTGIRVYFDDWGMVSEYKCDKITTVPQCTPFDRGYGF